MILYQAVVIEKTHVISITFMNLPESGYFCYSGHYEYEVKSLIFLMWASWLHGFKENIFKEKCILELNTLNSKCNH